MTEIEYQQVNSRLLRLEQNLPNDFLLATYTDLVRQHISLLKDLVHNRLSREDYENQIRLEKDVKILERNLEKLIEILSQGSPTRVTSNFTDKSVSFVN